MTMNDRRYIPFFRSYADYYWRLGTEAQKAEYIDMILGYAFNGTEPSVESQTFGVFTLIKPEIDRSIATMAARSEAGRRGGLAGRGTTRGIGNRNASKRKRNESKSTAKQKQSESKNSPLQPPTVLACTCTGNNNILTGGNTARDIARDPARPRAHEGRESESAADGQPILPTDDEMRLYARQLGVPESYLPEFLGEWEAVGWQRVNRGGALVTLNRRTFKSQLGAFWRQRQRNAGRDAGRARGTQPPGVKLGVSENFDYSRFAD